MTADNSQAAAITGGTNVGGIIGSNSGTLTNAYNTTSVNGANSTGSIVGSNSGTVQYVYGSSSLVGTGNGTLEYSYEINTDEKWNNAGSYEGFAFSDGKYDNQDGIWKIYEGYGHPLLKVFLTSASYKPDADTSFVYNGKEQGLNAGNVIAADGLGSYHNAEQLLQALLNKEVGDNYLGFVSEQIAASLAGGFNPNNLGYDIDVKYAITPSPINPELPKYDYLYKDNPFGRIKNFRERKAEINFVDGGMEI